MSMLKPKDVAKKIGVTVDTLQNWDNKGKLKAHRTVTNRRYYTETQINKLLGIKEPEKKRLNIAYARVSSHGQKDDLKNQINFIQQYLNANGIIMDEAITDIGSGLNYNRKKWNKLIDRVMNNEIDNIYITYPDRFIRFGFNWFKRFCQKFNTNIIVLNVKDSSPQQELVDDLINIVHVFSCRSYGIRKYKNKIEHDAKLGGEEKNDNQNF